MPGSARAHVPGMTKARKGKGGACVEGACLLSSARYVDRLRKRESDFHGKRMGFSELKGTSDQPDRIRRRFHSRPLDVSTEKHCKSEILIYLATL